MGRSKTRLRTVDEAMRRRFNLLPFTVTVPSSERDRDLAAKLREEWGGILKWMIAGCLAWQSEGLHPPKAVRDATRNYLASEDVLARWMEERCELQAAHCTPGGELFSDWVQWATVNGEFVGSRKQFSQSLESRGFVPKKTKVARGFLGIGLVTDVTDDSVISVTHARA